jgi:Kef-type K+ transport system membrane component KefB
MLLSRNLVRCGLPQEVAARHFEMVVSVLLLPFFFAVTGMRTRLDLLHGATMWFWTGVVLVVAVAGKIGGAVLASVGLGRPGRTPGLLERSSTPGDGSS